MRVRVRLQLLLVLLLCGGAVVGIPGAKLLPYRGRCFIWGRIWQLCISATLRGGKLEVLLVQLQRTKGIQLAVLWTCFQHAP